MALDAPASRADATGTVAVSSKAAASAHNDVIEDGDDLQLRVERRAGVAGRDTPISAVRRARP